MGVAVPDYFFLPESDFFDPSSGHNVSSGNRLISSSFLFVLNDDK
jgi:hypothetical protein